VGIHEIVVRWVFTHHSHAPPRCETHTAASAKRGFGGFIANNTREGGPKLAQASASSNMVKMDSLRAQSEGASREKENSASSCITCLRKAEYLHQGGYANCRDMENSMARPALKHYPVFSCRDCIYINVSIA